MSALIKSSLARKYAMALSGLFLVFFLLQHFTINLTSVFSEQVFNELSHFMGNNPIVQFALQPVLIIGVIFHFVMGFVLDLQNRAARTNKYTANNGAANSSWMSRNMIISGAVVLSFLGLHFYDFWFPELNYKYFEVLPENPNRYFEEMVHKFENPIRVGLYVLSFGFLALHLMHGFSSSFQSLGANNKYTRALKGFTTAFALGIPLGFVFIALFHHLNAF
ncbi:MAG: succinate dehydrogenase cytochrome b subunit [Flavobacteriaceae bacterium]